MKKKQFFLFTLSYDWQSFPAGRAPVGREVEAHPLLILEIKEFELQHTGRIYQFKGGGGFQDLKVSWHIAN